MFLTLIKLHVNVFVQILLDGPKLKQGAYTVDNRQSLGAGVWIKA